MANIGYANILNTINQTAAKNTAASQAMAERQMRFNKEEAQLSRNWQEMMSNTAHQREVKDLLAAGLNPILSVNGGAAVTSGAQAQGASGKVDESLSSALSNYLISLINSATQINVAGIQATASRYATDIGSKYSIVNKLGHGLLNSLSPESPAYEKRLYNANKHKR